jgi:hypothetical protein
MGRGFLAYDSYRLGASQNIASTTASTQSTAFGAQTYQIRLAATAAVNYRIDTNPTAVATDTLLPANWVELITVTPGQKLAVIGTATVNLTETTQ